MVFLLCWNRFCTQLVRFNSRHFPIRFSYDVRSRKRDYFRVKQHVASSKVLVNPRHYQGVPREKWRGSEADDVNSERKIEHRSCLGADDFSRLDWSWSRLYVRKCNLHVDIFRFFRPSKVPYKGKIVENIAFTNGQTETTARYFQWKYWCHHTD